MIYDAGEYDIAVIGAGHARVRGSIGECQTWDEDVVVFDQFGVCC